MALIKCPECGEKISDKSERCIHCGYPLSNINPPEEEKRDFIEEQNDIMPQQEIEEHQNKISTPKRDNMAMPPTYEKSQRKGCLIISLICLAFLIFVSLFLKENYAIFKITQTIWILAIIVGMPFSLGYLLLNFLKGHKLTKPLKFLTATVIVFCACIFIAGVSEPQEIKDERQAKIEQKEEKEKTETIEKTGEQEKNDSVLKSAAEANTEPQTETNPSETTSVNTDIQNQTINTDPFLAALSEYINEDAANTANDILKNQIGFSKLEFKQRMGETSNFELSADGYNVVLTAMDDYFRVFIPSTSYVFYDDGELLMTVTELEDSIISSEDMPYYYSIAQIIVEGCLKSPETAKFPWSDKISYQKKGNLVAIRGYVDAKNSFNAKIRNDYTVQFYVYDLKNLSYEATYIELGGNTSGKFIEMD